ncbi:unnamed protein product [Bemisia tabaci]|uniref:Major facilitator superfamily (MFS) profile domain-containing protein n=1 Tax=Bemisia tabaci TaxID=7038 RepID=A0A9P0AID5_BEMTA|nr:unnamed protein product [Bemisia tabaci]
MLTLTFSGTQRQLLAAFISTISLFMLGSMMGWPAPTLKLLREPDSPLHLTPSEEAWVVNALYFTTILSPLPSGALMNAIGRKATMLALCVFPAASWALIYFGRTASVLLAARVLAGFWVGGCQTIMPIYIGEIAEPRVRGIAGTSIMVNAFMGTIFVFIVGPYVSVPTMAVMNGVIPPVFFLLFSLCPESPYYYVMRGRHADAARTLAWLRGGAPIESELTSIQTSIEREAKAGQGYFKKMLSLFTVPANRKAFFVVEVMNFLQRFSGFSCLSAFSTVILPAHAGPLTADQCTLLLGAAWLISSLCCSALIDRLGRKPLLYFSSLGILVSMLPTAVWYYLDRETSTDVREVEWVPFAGFLLFGLTFSAGLGSIGPAITGEMFPSHLKGQASALTTITAAASSSLSIALFSALDARVGMYANFLIFAAVGPVSGVFTYFCVIETKGKSLQMIQAELNGEKVEKPEKNGKI